MASTKYIQARREGLREVHALSLKGKNPSLPVLSEILPEINRLSQVPLGVIQVSMDQIVGTVTKGRTSAFSRSFLPLLEQDSEFAAKWSALYDAVIEEGLRQPIKAMEYYNEYYVIEGNKRVSVMRSLESPLIEADVTRVMPTPEDTPRWRIYQEYLRFYDDTKINSIRFEREGGYTRLCALLGHKVGEKWSGDAVFDLQSCYYRFCQAYKARAKGQMPMSPGDAFLIYLEVFRFDESYNKTPAEFGKDLERIWKEFLVAGAQKPQALLNQPGEKQQGILKSVLRMGPQTVRCAFLYNRSPDVSGWTYWHELGRKALEEAFGSHVETIARENIPVAKADEVIEELAAQGYSVIFATTPLFLNSCMRMSVAHPELKILNCSLLASYHNVRSYYLRIYEAKFILGAIAGALAEDDQIGYIADYPIYGTPASINAFALGAQMTNPRARIILDWSTLPEHNPEAALAEQHVHIISGRDISAPKLESRAFGVYSSLNGDIQNLAMPVWNWEKLYHGIVRSILTGAWEDEDENNADRALSYYMGMSTDAIDIICSKAVPVRLHRLVDLLHERIRSGAFLPFVGPIYDQDGELRVDKDTVLTPLEIISMDYLARNVEGRIPKFHELVESAQALVELQGIRAVKPEADDALGTEGV